MGPPPAPTDREQNIRLILAYDANADGKVTRDELEAGLKREFVMADRNGDGVLDLPEIQAENARRFAANRTGFSPLIDWNRDGKVDFSEFATTMRSLFEDMDRSRNGVLEGAELRLPRVRGAGPPPRRAPMGP
jgi:Ca2+-binding EF-hand superfamily protein